MEKRQPFYRQLKRERERHGWSQADVASKLGVDTKTINRWESGKSLPRHYHRQALSELLGKTAEELGILREEFDTSLHLSKHQEDWGEAPHIWNFYGRDKELGALKEWIIDDRCRIVTILGMGGVGKTALSASLIDQIKDEFKYVFWRSLQNAPPLEYTLKHYIQFVSNQRLIDLPELIDDQISLLMQYLRDHRCLLVLDNFESVLRASNRAGHYREGYEGYGRLIQLIGEVKHQSCLLLTSREKPKEIVRLEGNISPVRSLQLLGVGQLEGQAILKDKGLFGTDEAWSALIQLYSGNPLALKLVSEFIRELFEGDIATFLKKGKVVFGDIRDPLDQQFSRLTKFEQEILYWLAIEREAISLDDLREDIVHSVPEEDLFVALGSLRRRSMIEIRGTRSFTLQSVIMEYVTDRFIEQVAAEIDTGTLYLFGSHALIKAQSKDYVRDSQIRIILTPIVERLLSNIGKEGIEKKLKGILSMLREAHTSILGYTAGNILNLLVHLKSDLSDYNFSHLIVRQAYLQGIALPNVNFSHSNLARSLFTETFRNILSVAFSPNGKLLAAGTANGEIWIWQAHSGTLLHIFRGHKNWVRTVVFNPDGNILASGSDDQTVRLWTVDTGQCLKILQGHSERVRSVTFSPDRKIIASGSEDQTVRLWEVSSGRCLKILQGHTNQIMSVAFSPDGKIIASGSEDQTVRLWEVNTGQCLKILQGHTHWVGSIAFSPDGSTLASGSDDQTVRLWNIYTGHCLKILQGQTSRVRSVAFSPDAQVLASGSDDDGMIRLWNVQTGRILKILRNDRPYENMNITNVSGLTEVQKATLKALGAIEDHE